MPEVFSKTWQMTAEEFKNIQDEEERRKIWDNSELKRLYGNY
jgi:hypothetical protein